MNGDGRPALRGGYGIAYERNFGNVTYNVLFNPPLYLVATIDVAADVPSQPIYADNGGPFGGVAGRHARRSRRAACATSTRTSRPRTSHFYGVSFRRSWSPG